MFGRVPYLLSAQSDQHPCWMYIQGTADSGRPWQPRQADIPEGGRCWLRVTGIPYLDYLRISTGSFVCLVFGRLRLSSVGLLKAGSSASDRLFGVMAS